MAERVLLVQQDSLPQTDNGSLDELRCLAESAGAEVCGELLSQRKQPQPATFIGSGKVTQLAGLVESVNATLVLFDHAISPTQERNLERAVNCRVLDRTGLILDIFAQRATTHEGKLQVELAQLKYLSTRLVRGWTHLERQKGGIGLRGPGETQLETDRRLIGARIKTLQRRLQRVESQRELRRRARRKVPIPTVSLVGYTNAGKSSLFNRLTKADVYAADRLFATLDPTMRKLEVPGFGPVVLSDTVGFIRDLPHSLVNAFHSTLEEVSQARLLLHVIDVSDPDQYERLAQVEEVLKEIGAEDIPRIDVYNKMDLVRTSKPACHNHWNGRQRVWVSAHEGEGVNQLLQAIHDELAKHRQQRVVTLPMEAARLRAKLYRHCDVVHESVLDDGSCRMVVNLETRDEGWLTADPDFQSQFWSDRP